MKFPERRFWWKCRLTLWGVDLLSILLLVGSLRAVLELYLDPSWLLGLIVQTALIVTLLKFPPSRRILRRWSRAEEAYRRRDRLKQWRDLKASGPSPSLRREPWFQKPS